MGDTNTKLTKAEEKVYGRIIVGEKAIAREFCQMQSKIGELEARFEQLLETVEKGK